MPGHSWEPPPGLPWMPPIRHSPGLADKTMRELAPFLAEEGIDLDSINDIETLQRALNRASERRNTELFSPVGPARSASFTVLRRFAVAFVAGDRDKAATLLDAVPPEAPRDKAYVAGCIGLTLDLCDHLLGGHESDAPVGLGARVQLAAGDWPGRLAATDVLAVGRKSRSFRSLGKLIGTHGGHPVMFGSALVLASTLRSWSDLSGVPVAGLANDYVR